MGHARRRPQHLAEKLLQIRNALGISQPEMHRRLGVTDEIPYTRISDYELDKAEPTLMVLLQYARLAGIHMEALVDDNLKLPAQLPGPLAQGSVERLYPARKRKRNS
jgi:transcriptional regulator with XRE-family HTH domain